MSAESRKWLQRAAEPPATAKEEEEGPLLLPVLPPEALLDDENLGVMLRRPRELGQAAWDNDAMNTRRLLGPSHCTFASPAHFFTQTSKDLVEQWKARMRMTPSSF